MGEVLAYAPRTVSVPVIPSWQFEAAALFLELVARPDAPEVLRRVRAELCRPRLTTVLTNHFKGA